MPTDDERRSIAAALRAYEGKGADVDTIGEVMAIIIGAGDFEGWSWREVFARLAELIDPVEKHFADSGKMVDREALLALADDMVAIAGTYPKKGSTLPLLLRFARRIREACGVEP